MPIRKNIGQTSDCTRASTIGKISPTRICCAGPKRQADGPAAASGRGHLRPRPAPGQVRTSAPARTARHEEPLSVSVSSSASMRSKRQLAMPWARCHRLRGRDHLLGDSVPLNRPSSATILAAPNAASPSRRPCPGRIHRAQPAISSSVDCPAQAAPARRARSERPPALSQRTAAPAFQSRVHAPSPFSSARRLNPHAA